MKKYEVKTMGKKKEKVVEPKFILSPLNNPMINYKVYYMTAGEKILYTAVSIILGGLAGLVFYGGLFKEDGEATVKTYISNAVVFAVVGLVAAKFAMPAINKILLSRRAKKLRKQFIDMLETISTLLSSGSTVNDAFFDAKTDLANQYQENALIMIELGEIVSGVQNGKTLEEMLNAFGVRSDNKDIMNFANVISNCYRLGGDFNNVVRRTRDVICDKIQIEEEIATKVSSNKLQLNAMSLMPIVLVGMLKVSSDGFAENLSTTLGIVVTTFSIGLFAVAYFWGQKIINIK